MLALIALLFKASYWRMLLRGATWREAGLSLRRAHKDRRARKHVGRVLLLALIPFLCLLWIAWFARLFTLYAVPVILLAALWLSRRPKQQSAPPSVVPRPKPIFRELNAEEQRAFRNYFADVALIYAVMLSRASSESYLATKELPEGYEVTTRRVHLELLKSSGVWEKMDQQDREALIVQDGGWNAEWVNFLVMGLEPLRLMRWMLRIDYFLPTVGQQIRLDFSVATDIVREPQKLRSGNDLATPKAIEIGRHAAEQFYNRCVAEKISRGLSEAKDQRSLEVASDISAKLGGKQHEDLVIGDKLVSEATAEQLEWATMLSRRRLAFFHWTGEAMERGTPPPPPYKFQP